LDRRYEPVFFCKVSYQAVEGIQFIIGSEVANHRRRSDFTWRTVQQRGGTHAQRVLRGEPLALGGIRQQVVDLLVDEVVHGTQRVCGCGTQNGVNVTSQSFNKFSTLPFTWIVNGGDRLDSGVPVDSVSHKTVAHTGLSDEVASRAVRCFQFLP
jgi:hypothetical protein